MNKTIRTAIATAAFGGMLLAASPASAAVASYSTNFDGVTINGATPPLADGTIVDPAFSTADWRMSGAFDAEMTGDALRISNAATSGSFGDQLFSPKLAVGAVEDTDVNTFKAAFTLESVALQPGLRVTVSPDNGEGGRAGFLVVEHTKQGMTLSISGSNGSGSAWPGKVVATKLNPLTVRTVEVKLVKVTDTKSDDTNDTFSVRVKGGKWVTVNTFEAYYKATGEDEYPTDTLLFRVSGTAVPSLAGAGLLIDDLSISTS